MNIFATPIADQKICPSVIRVSLQIRHEHHKYNAHQGIAHFRRMSDVLQNRFGNAPSPTLRTVHFNGRLCDRYQLYIGKTSVKSLIVLFCPVRAFTLLLRRGGTKCWGIENRRDIHSTGRWFMPRGKFFHFMKIQAESKRPKRRKSANANFHKKNVHNSCLNNDL